MTPGLRTHRQASLRIAIPECVPEHMREGMREILSVESGEKGSGHARALMYQVIAEADRAGMVLMLTVRPFAEGLTAEQLEKFYGSFGFERIQDEPVLMARQAEPLMVAYG